VLRFGLEKISGCEALQALANGIREETKMAGDREPTYGWNSDMPQSLHDKLKDDLKTAMRAKDETARNTIRQIMAEYPRLTVPITLESGKKSTRLKRPEEITAEDIMGILRGLVKAEETVLEATGGEPSPYLQMLKAYLPRPVEKEEIVAWIAANVDFSRYQNKMQAMGAIMKHFGKRVDGRMVNQILKEWQ
jgi:uncharacterized protein YqeY